MIYSVTNVQSTTLKLCVVEQAYSVSLIFYTFYDFTYTCSISHFTLTATKLDNVNNTNNFFHNIMENKNEDMKVHEWWRMGAVHANANLI